MKRCEGRPDDGGGFDPCEREDTSKRLVAICPCLTETFMHVEIVLMSTIEITFTKVTISQRLSTTIPSFHTTG